MIRFLPDTLRDALMRPIAMAAPDGGVYVEIMAPDARFAILELLVLVWLVTAIRKRASDPLGPLAGLLAWMAVAFAVWMGTTGNGRYFMPALILAGPLVVGLIARLPGTLTYRAALAGAAVLVQAVVVFQSPPWGSWKLGPWNDSPFFEVRLDERARHEAATYVTATAISYSLLAPRFPEASRWVNISSQPDPDTTEDGRRIQALLAASSNLQLLAPTKFDYVTPEGYPDARVTEVLNNILRNQHLEIKARELCRLLPSSGLASLSYAELDKVSPAKLAKFGFWVCPLNYPVKRAVHQVDDGGPRITGVFGAIEQACPRLFPPGSAVTARLADGYLRDYSSTDLKVYVMDDGDVFYKYWRALNAELIGKTSAVLSDGFRMDCTSVRGRSGLPWERQL